MTAEMRVALVWAKAENLLLTRGDVKGGALRLALDTLATWRDGGVHPVRVAKRMTDYASQMREERLCAVKATTADRRYWLKGQRAYLALSDAILDACEELSRG